MRDEAVEEAVILVVDGADGEAWLSEEDGGELDQPRGFFGEATDDDDDTEGLCWRERGPPLGEEIEAAGVGGVGGGVRYIVRQVELLQHHGAE